MSTQPQIVGEVDLYMTNHGIDGWDAKTTLSDRFRTMGDALIWLTDNGFTHYETGWWWHRDPERRHTMGAITYEIKPAAHVQTRPVEADPIHQFFGLSYAQYIALPRSVLQSMPSEWQQRFVACLEELDHAIDWRPARGTNYKVELREDKGDEWGRQVRDPFADYDRGLRRIDHRDRSLV